MKMGIFVFYNTHVNLPLSSPYKTVIQTSKEIDNYSQRKKIESMEEVNHDDHHDQDQNHENERGSSGVGGSRWNPTKEQIGILERMYSEGIRTPSADQIQQITARLRAFGPIEGKNVFYWFQNHKARQRQKQRQERLAVANAHHNFLAPPPFHHHHHRLPNPVIDLNFNPKPMLPSPSPYHHQYLPTSPNGICNPYYQFPQTNQGFYPPRPPRHNYSAPAADDHLGSGNRRSKVGSIAMMMMNTTKSFDHHDDQEDGGHCRCMETRTLNLFPVHPTGILEHKLGNSMNNSSTTINACDDDMCTVDKGSYQPGPGPEMFDFFSSSETDHD